MLRHLLPCVVTLYGLRDYRRHRVAVLDVLRLGSNYPRRCARTDAEHSYTTKHGKDKKQEAFHGITTTHLRNT